MINYKVLYESIEYYSENGFERIESPWTVTENIRNITKPDHIKHESNQFAFRENDKSLVASGEQSFLYLYNKGFLPLGKFQTITPCFRSDSFDTTHTKYFMKNELIDTCNVSEAGLSNILNIAINFFSKYHKKENLIIQKISETQYDINLLDRIEGEVELGSYGIRECSFLKWIYGTGVAEPRFSRFMRD